MRQRLKGELFLVSVTSFWVFTMQILIIALGRVHVT